MTERQANEDGGGELIGYTDQLSVCAGETVRFMVSSSAPNYDCRVVRLVHGDSNKEGPGFREEQCLTSADGRYAGRRQFVHAGSYVEVVDDPSFELSSFTLQTWIEPTLPGNGKRQAIMSRWCSAEERGYGLFIGEDGRLVLLLGARSGVTAVETSDPVRPSEWYFVAASFDSEQARAVMYVEPLSPWAKREKTGLAASLVDIPDWPVELRVPFRIGATSCSRDARSITNAYNGKIDSPRVFDRAVDEWFVHELASGTDPLTLDRNAVVAAWDFSADQSSTRITDGGPRGLHGRTVNLPGRAVTGRNWSGREVDFRQAPGEYGAIHFHSDDVEDARWEVDFQWTVPDDTKSGIYAARLQAAGDLHDHIPFVVTPGRGQRRKQIAFLLPTMTYLAYANERLGDPMQPCCPPDWPSIPEPLDDYLAQRPEFGKSLYDTHEDSSGVFYSSARRPIPNLRPLYRSRFLEGAARHLAGDLYLIAWLERKGFAYDVITDNDLHARGREILASYHVLITGSHPEYCSKNMLDALEGWIHDGGRMMYLGGNGFFWVTSVHPELPHVIEVRRGNTGSEPWEPRPGELHHSTTGEMGGLWRFRGRLPNRILGVGFAAQGADGDSVGYRRDLGREHVASAADWVFAGVTEDVIGSYGLVMGGAVGDEIDRADVDLGTPPETLLLATSEPLGEHYCVTAEDARPATRRGSRSAGEVRADMVLLEAWTGGAVFSVGSISWTGSLSHNDYENGVARITENVLRRFARSEQ